MLALFHTPGNRKFVAAFAVAVGLLCGVFASEFPQTSATQVVSARNLLVAETYVCCDSGVLSGAAQAGFAMPSPERPQTPRPSTRPTTLENIVGDLVGFSNLPAIVAGLVVVLVFLVFCVGVLLRRRDR
ncbi:hypothetical protein [Corynebacterium sp.]|uniref:hypothetical protein n=1 Tax=Corynebacterium sp. TaxID=1720 RepID=UPI0026DC0C26|nr:hypothetical protein [Corynebacterium sp.]MDO5076248.1 hypothetical protein [Corynebacterium sp.]